MARRRGQAGADSDASNTAAMLAQQYGVAKTGRKDAAAESLGPSTDFFGRVKAPAIVEDPGECSSICQKLGRHDCRLCATGASGP